MTEITTANTERGQVMKKHRRARGWTQEQLAIVANVTVRTIQRLESGESPAAETLMAVAQAFGMKAEHLNPTAESVSEMASRRYVHLLPRLTTVSDLTAVISRAHRCHYEHDDSADPRSINAMKDILEAIREDVQQLQDARPEDRQVIEAELARELQSLQSLGYFLFGIMRVVPTFADEHVLLLTMATIYITHSRSPKIVKANNIMVIPAILPEEAEYSGTPAFMWPVY